MLPIFLYMLCTCKASAKNSAPKPVGFGAPIFSVRCSFLRRLLHRAFQCHSRRCVQYIACSVLRTAYRAFLNPLRHFPTCALGGIEESIRRVALGKSALPTPYLSIRYIRLVVGVVVRWKMWITGANPLRLPISHVDENVETTRENPKKAQLIHTPPAPDRAAGVCGASIYFSRMIFRSSTSAFFRF